jgi:outer membrane receptor for ferrienterochelin and colicins
MKVVGILGACGLALALVHPCRLAAQATATLSGVVRSNGQVLQRARVDALLADGVRGGARSDESGVYRLRLAPGEYTVLFRLPGYAPRRVDGVRVAASGITTLDADLVEQPVELNRLVVSAARRSEKLLDVAAAVNVVDEAAVRRRVVTSPLDHVLSVPGVDVAVQGLQGRQVVGRGFNGTFAPALLTLSDYRNTALPSLRAALSYFLTPNIDDLDRVEVVRGPASALYGSNAADGVVHFITKSPFDSPGTSVSLAGGQRNVFEATARHAAVLGDRVAVKLSGTYFRGREWSALPQPSETVAREPIAERANGEFRADVRVRKTGRAVLTLGTTNALRAVEYSPIGTYNLDRSRADFAQVRYSEGRFFAQAYGTFTDGPAGSTINLQTGQSAIDKSVVAVGQVQHGLTLGGRADLTYGVDVQRTDPRTNGTVNGRNEAEDVTLETGAYLQSSTRIGSRLQLVTAGRVDAHNRLGDPVFSPRVALLFTPRDGQRFRASYNSAFSAPTPGNFFLDVVAATLSPLPYTVRAVGVPKAGLQFDRSCGGVCMASPFAPGVALPLDATRLWPVVVQTLQQQGVDISGIPAPTATDVATVLRALDLRNGTFVNAGTTVTDLPALKPTVTRAFELGYKGLLGGRALLDVAVYSTRRTNFVAPLTVATPNAFLSTAALTAYLARFLPAAQAGQLAAGIGGVDGNAQAPGIPLGTVTPSAAADSASILLSYRNVGDVSLWGTDVSLEYAVNEHLAVNGAYSFVSDNFFAGQGGGSDLSTNTPRSKALLSARVFERSRDASIELRGRYVGAFRMVDGVWSGRVNSYVVGDLEAGIAIPGTRDARFTVSVQNLADARHSEFVAAPILGRLVLTRVQYRF